MSTPGVCCSMTRLMADETTRKLSVLPRSDASSIPGCSSRSWIRAFRG